MPEIVNAWGLMISDPATKVGILIAMPVAVIVVSVWLSFEVIRSLFFEREASDDRNGVRDAAGARDRSFADSNSWMRGE